LRKIAWVEFAPSFCPKPQKEAKTLFAAVPAHATRIQLALKQLFVFYARYVVRVPPHGSQGRDSTPPFTAEGLFERQFRRRGYPLGCHCGLDPQPPENKSSFIRRFRVKRGMTNYPRNERVVLLPLFF
jgi:hypothetical protein